MPLQEIQHPAVDVDLRYATVDNFTGQRIYDHAAAFLHKDALDALYRAAALAQALGWRLCVLDAYRPSAAQWRLWATVPDPRFVLDPRVGSLPRRGVAADLTLGVDQGLVLDMGTAFDEMTEQSFHARTDISRQAQSNRLLLLGIMVAAGWEHHPCEWWHYNLPEPTRYPILSDRVEGTALMDLPPLAPVA